MVARSLGIALAFLAHAAPPLAVADIRISIPPSWRARPVQSDQRIAQFGVPGKAGEGEAVVYFFGSGQGGSPEDTVARWLGQFTPAPGDKQSSSREARDLGGARVLVVRARGAYQPAMHTGDPAPRAGWALFGLVIDSPRGPVFVKVTGPQATLTAEGKRLQVMVRSIRLVE